jgi:hypothetical protein
MRTPDGQECPFYYAGYHRNLASKEVCHLLDGQPDAARWTSALCTACPVPDIRRTNGCTQMILHGHIGKRGWRLWEAERLLVDVTCTRSGKSVANPYVGCGQCHSNITFVVGEDKNSPNR